jgi:hypothetical protein
MNDTRSVRMDEDERDAFLGTGGTGVISFSRGAEEPPHSLPVSYGYDPDSGGFYLRLAFDTESEKDDVVAADRPLSLVVHGQTDDGWRSVVVTGHLEEVTEAAIESEVAQAMRRVHIPLVDVFDRHPRELTFRFFRLVVDELSGRKEAKSA